MFVPPIIRCLYDDRLRRAPKNVRHQIELPLIRAAVTDLLDRDGKKAKNFQIKWDKTGRPLVGGAGLKGVSISLSHDDNFLIVVAGYGKQGCDVEMIKEKDPQDWLLLLTKDKYKLVEELLNNGCDLNFGSTAVWCSVEVEKKIGNTKSTLSFEEKQKDMIIFSCKVLNKNYLIVNFPLLLSHCKQAIVSFIVDATRYAPHKISEINKTNFLKSYGYDENIYAIDLDFSGPRKQLVFIKKFPMTFRSNQELSRKVYFTNYFNWMGEVRENATHPIYKQLANLVNTGGWGVVSNSARLTILGDVQATDTVEGRMWVEDISGKNNEIIDLTFDWRSISGDGKYQRVAKSEMRVTWVNIISRGVVRVTHLPDFMQKFFETMKPRVKERSPLDKLPEPFSGMSQGKKIFSINNLDRKIKLHDSAFTTSLEDSNLIGNIYFANYAQWLGVVRDTYFYSVAPDYFNGLGEGGELVSFDTEINFLNEGMPFNKIFVAMYLQTLYESGCDLFFEFYLTENNSLNRKLAVAKHRVLWLKRVGRSVPKVEKFPKEIFDSLKHQKR